MIVDIVNTNGEFLREGVELAAVPSRGDVMWDTDAANKACEVSHIVWPLNGHPQVVVRCMSNFWDMFRKSICR